MKSAGNLADPAPLFLTQVGPGQKGRTTPNS